MFCVLIAGCKYQLSVLLHVIHLVLLMYCFIPQTSLILLSHVAVYLLSHYRLFACCFA